MVGGEGEMEGGEEWQIILVHCGGTEGKCVCVCVCVCVCACARACVCMCMCVTCSVIVLTCSLGGIYMDIATILQQLSSSLIPRPILWVLE